MVHWTSSFKTMKFIKLILTAFLLVTAGCASGSKEDTVIMNENGINTVKMDDREMGWFRFGNENGPKVIILPGLSLKSVMGSKDAVIAGYSLLAADYDVYLFDRVRVMPETYDIEAMADDTLRAVKAIGLENVNVMGVSQGAMIGLMMELKDPDAVNSLMLCSASSRIHDRSALETWKKLAEERNLPALMESFGEYVYTPSFFEQYKDLILASGNGATEQNYKNFITAVEGTLAFDCYDRLKDIHCPSLVIGASEDRVLGVQASYDLAQELHSEIFIYEGYGHGVYDEAPDYLTHIKQFLDKVN
ncbi:MAG TPA: hypothetical protein DHW39_03965 [Erysipelotrichaceae bacterium]|nr:hypothetical protein [Erysipelotrichaceae bacterium]